MIIFLRERLEIKNKTSVIYGLLACVLVITLVVCLFKNQDTTLAQNNLSMYSGSYALTDGATGRVLVGKNETNPMANASTTKILTCIVTLENANLNDLVTISSNAASQPQVRLGMGEGEKYPLKDLLYGLMLESYNDCAVAIAEHVAGDTENFAYLLNEKAKEIGCADTYFITPNGLDAEDENGFHHTTATDLCKIMSYCVWESPMKDVFLEITQARNYTGSSNGNTYSFTNHNAFLDQMDGVLSGKTGFTAKAGYCYVAAFERDGEKYCIALLACGWPNNKTYKWQDARTLFNYGMENYDVKTILVNDISEDITVQGYIDNADFVELNDVNYLKAVADKRQYEVLLGKDEVVEQEIILYTDVKLPILEGQEIGVCNLYINDTLFDSFSLIASESSKQWDMFITLKIILSKFLTFSS